MLTAPWNSTHLVPLAAQRSMPDVLTVSERAAIAEQLLLLLKNYYVHLPLKVSSLAINPLQQVRFLQDDVPYIENDSDCFRRIRLIFDSLKDRHTNFVLPEPWTRLVAYLPFAVESCWVGNRRLLMVTKIMGNIGNTRFKVGSEITHWNGVPIRRYVEQLSWETLGSNSFARVALALRSMTARSLGHGAAPAEDWVNLTFVSDRGTDTIVIPWYIYSPFTSPLGGSGIGTGSADLSTGLDKSLTGINVSLAGSLFWIPRGSNRQARHFVDVPMERDPRWH